MLRLSYCDALFPWKIRHLSPEQKISSVVDPDVLVLQPQMGTCHGFWRRPGRQQNHQMLVSVRSRVHCVD